MSDKPAPFDNGGHLPKPIELIQVQDDVTPTRELIITGLDAEQFDRLAEGISSAIRPEAIGKQSLTGKIVAHSLGLALGGVGVAGALWLIAAIVTHMPGR